MERHEGKRQLARRIAMVKAADFYTEHGEAWGVEDLGGMLVGLLETLYLVDEAGRTDDPHALKEALGEVEITLANLELSVGLRRKE